MLKHLSLLLVLLLASGLSGCNKQAESVKPPETYFPLDLGGHTIQVQLALTPSEQSQGLMHRDNLAPDHGMLFVFRSPGQRSFWMHNTLIPLDIGYFTADGMLREVYPMQPRDRTSVQSIRNDILYALEMNQGWFAENKIRPGARLNLDQLETAIRKRQTPG